LRAALRGARACAGIADGVPSKTVMDDPENARTLKFTDFGFEEE